MMTGSIGSKVVKVNETSGSQYHSRACYGVVARFVMV